jgi:SAM-dependent methyltransferase
MTATLFNHSYLINRAKDLCHKDGGGRVLDFGCGTGQVVALGLAGGLDIWGADTFEGFYTDWRTACPAGTAKRISRIEDGRLAFPDAHFDVVLCNQVFGHIADPTDAIADIARVLRPGGTLIAAYPVRDTWYEGHVGLYFAHRFKPGSRLRHAYMAAAHRCGFGLYGTGMMSDAWAQMSGKVLDEGCYFHRRQTLVETMRAHIGTPRDVSADYMRARLGHRAARLPAVLLRSAYHKRAGQIYEVMKGE